MNYRAYEKPAEPDYAPPACRIDIATFCVYHVSGGTSNYANGMVSGSKIWRTQLKGVWLWHAPPARGRASICPKDGRTTRKGMSSLQLPWVMRLINNRWKYMPRIIMDGNFSAEHQPMKNPQDDVRLADGQSFFVTSRPYKEHLKTAVHFHQVKNVTIHTCLTMLTIDIETGMSRASCSSCRNISESASGGHRNWGSGLQQARFFFSTLCC